MNTPNPSLAEFLAKAEEMFDFLTCEYGFERISHGAAQSSQPYQLRYENATTAVLVEGLSWGTAATVWIGKKGARQGSDFALVPLWTLARMKSEQQAADLQVLGQHAQLQANAIALRNLAAAALQGEFSAVDTARIYLKERVRKATQGEETQ